MKIISFLRILVVLAVLSIMTAVSSSLVLAEPSSSEPVYFSSASSDGTLHGEIAQVVTSHSTSLVGIESVPSVNVQILKDSGASSNRVDLVFLGDGYTADELGNYAASVNQLSTAMFAQAPLTEFANYFNFHRIDVISNESGADNDPLNGSLKDTALDSQFWCHGSADTLCTDTAKVLEYAAQSRDSDQAIVLVNSSNSGAAAYPFSDLSVVSAGQTLASESLLHQFGHSFANLADEFDTGSWPDYTGFEPAEPNVSAQTAASMTLQKIKWHKWLGVDLGSQYGGIVGVNEGAMGHLRGIYRPTLDSKMRTLNKPFNAPSVESFIEQIYRVVSPIDDATPPTTGLIGKDTLFVKPMQPIGRNLDIQWFANGVAVPGATGSTFRPNNFPFADGTYTISVTVTDNTSFVKDESFRSQYMTASRSWSVAIDENPPIITSQPSDISVVIGQSGVFSVIATGEDLSYQWYKNGVAIPGATSPTYTTPASARSDSGSQYVVQVINTGGTVSSAPAKLIVLNRAPILPPITNQQMTRGETRLISLGAIDLDNDPLVITAILGSTPTNTGAKLTIVDNALQIVTGASFMGTFTVQVSATDRIDFTNQSFTVTVTDRLPVIQPISNQSMHWKTDFITIPITATDPDGDPVTLSAALVAGQSAAVTISLSGTNLKVDPANSFLGGFDVKVDATSSGKVASQIFHVDVYDNAPVIQPIGTQQMYWKNDYITVPVTATDPDGDTLTIFADQAVGGTAPVGISMSGTSIVVNPAANYIGVINVTVTASDSKKYTTYTFPVNVYNSAPVIKDIAAQSMHYKTDSISVPIDATDPDGDQITLSATLPPGTNAPVTLSVQGKSIIVNPADNYLGTFPVRVRASDATAYTEQTFLVTVYNRAPVISPIPDQKMHWKQDKLTITIPASDPDNETVTLSADVLGQVSPVPTLTFSGSDLTIDPPTDYLGSFVISVRATDGLASDVRSFVFTTYNSDPDLQPICDRNISWSQSPLDVTLIATDADNEALTYSGTVEPYSGIYDLDQKYNFSIGFDDSAKFNQLGLQEKYIHADKNQGGAGQSYLILPNGELYEYRGGIDNAKILIASLPTAFYQDLSLLVDVSTPPSVAPATATVDGNILHITPDQNFRGTFLVRARVRDAQLFDEEPFLVTVFDSGIRLSKIDPIRFHWRDAQKTVALSVSDSDGSADASTVAYQAELVSTTQAENLDNLYDFNYSTIKNPQSPDNITGHGEKYFYGPKDYLAQKQQRAGTQKFDTIYLFDAYWYFDPLSLFAILPNGELYECAPSVPSGTGTQPYASQYLLSSSSKYIATLPAVYYEDPTLLFNVPKGPTSPPFTLTVSGSNLTVSAKPGFVGKAIIRVQAQDGHAADSQLVEIEAYNTKPNVDSPSIRTQANSFGKELYAIYPYKLTGTGREFRIPLAIGEGDAQDINAKTVRLIAKSYRKIYSELISTYSLSFDVKNTRFNELGWREKHLSGVYQGQAADFILLPTNALYVWKGSIEQSIFISFLENPFQESDIYSYPNYFFYTATLPAQEDPLFSQMTARLEGSDFVFTLPAHPAQDIQHTYAFTIEVSDGNKADWLPLFVISRNSVPDFATIPDMTMHWRSDRLNIPLTISEPDGDTPVISFRGNSANGTFFNALDPAAPPFPGSGVAQGSTLILDPHAEFLGRLEGYITVKDQFSSGANIKNFFVNVVNNAPTLNPIGARTMNWRDDKLVINLQSSDPDGVDVPYLSYKAYLGTHRHEAYRLDQIYHFNQGIPYSWNKFGFLEMHFLGLVGGVQKEFIILPSGKIFQWNTNIENSTYIGTMPSVDTPIDGAVDYRTQPYLLQNVPAQSVLPDVAVSMSGSTLTIDPKTVKYVGSFPVTVSVTDGNKTVFEQIQVTVNNTAPVISALATKNLGWKETLTYPITVTDAENDPVTISATAAPESATLVNVSVSGNSVIVTPKKPYVGSAKINVTASDSLLTSATSSFVINYTNRAPTINAVPVQTMRWNEKSRTIQLSGTDPDGDALTYSGAVTYNPTGGTVSVSGSALTLKLTNFVDTMYITAYVSDGSNTANTTFKVSVNNSAPVIQSIPTQNVPWRTDQISVPVTATDVDGDIPTLSARIISTPTFPADVRMVGSALTAIFTNHQVGSFTVQVTANDGLLSTTAIVVINVTNAAPVLEPIAEQISEVNSGPISVDMNATDQNNDPLTYTAQVLSDAEVVYQLDKANNFDLRFNDYYFNKLGNNEKYVQGTKNLANGLYWYVIYPNGRFYEWSGQLTTSRYLATLPVEYYNNPSLLFDKTAPAANSIPATVSVPSTGKTVRITPSTDYIGKFWVRAAVTDTKTETVTYFGVEISPKSSSGSDSGNSCSASYTDRRGDYHDSSSKAFVAEAKVGDSYLGSNSKEKQIRCTGSGTTTGNSGEEGHYTFKNGQRTSFSLSYDPDTLTVRFVVGGVVTSHQLQGGERISDLYVRSNSRYDDDSITVDQLKLNGEPVSNTCNASISHGRTNVLQIKSGNLNKKFTLEGSALMRFASTGSKIARDSDVSLQVSAGLVEGHRTSCDDNDEERKVKICHMPEGNPYNGHTIEISRSALPTHLAHGDVIGECPSLPMDPGDGGGTCEEKRIIKSPNYALWTGFLGITDIAELTNPSNSDLPVKISFFSITGALVHQRTVTVPAMNQIDVIINDFPGFIPDSYGVIKLEFTGPLDGRIMYYRPSSDGNGFDFAFDMPLNDANFGTTAVSFNTFQPSQKPEEQNNLVANWLSIVNLDSAEQHYSVFTYGFSGNLILKREIDVPAFGRVDIDGGHDLAGPNVVGVHVIVPKNVTAEYIAQLTRFGGNAPAGYVSSKYKFAFPLSAKLGQSDPIYAPISNKFNEYNWIEIVNILDKAVGAAINLYDNNGQLLESVDATINPHSQLHFNATDYLGAGQTGFASIVPREPFSIIAQSMGYLVEPTSSSVTAVYGSQARRALPCLQSGSYNLYIEITDWILVGNTTNNPVTAAIQLTGPNLMSEKTISLPPKGSVYLPIHDPAQFGAKKNTYGLIAVKPTDPSVRLFAEVMRVRYRADGTPDFAAPTPIR